MMAFETMIADRYEVDPSYFADKYGMPVGNRREITPPTITPDDDNNSDDSKTPEGKSKQKNDRLFFD